MKAENKWLTEDKKCSHHGDTWDVVEDSKPRELNAQPVTIIEGHLADALRWRLTHGEPPKEGQLCIVYDNVTQLPSVCIARLDQLGRPACWDVCNVTDEYGDPMTIAAAHTQYRPLTPLDRPTP